MLKEFDATTGWYLLSGKWAPGWPKEPHLKISSFISWVMK